jgi:hypothetical protein
MSPRGESSPALRDRSPKFQILATFRYTPVQFFDSCLLPIEPDRLPGSEINPFLESLPLPQS